MNLKLVKTGVFDHCYCSLTEDLDEIAGFDIKKNYLYRHYILMDSLSMREKCLDFRVPGRTQGSIIIDDNNKITDIIIVNYAHNFYSEDTREKLLKKYKGAIIEY